MIISKNKDIIFSFLLFSSLALSLFNNFYQIKMFDKYGVSKKGPGLHLMIYADIAEFWKEADQISKDLRDGKNYLDTGGDFRRPYLPSRTISLFSNFFSKNLLTEDGRVSLGAEKVILLAFQSLFYYLLLSILYIKILTIFPKLNSQILILFLAYEPTIFQFHSSFWSESIFFSMQLLIILFILKKNYNPFSLFLFGILLGFFYLQRSVAIFYIFVIFFYFYLVDRKNLTRYFSFILPGMIIIFLFLGFHNYKRSGVFHVVSTQAKDGFYIYLVPEIIANKKDISTPDALKELLQNEKEWVVAEKINFNIDEVGNIASVNETGRLKVFEYRKKISINYLLAYPITSVKVILNKTLHFFIIDPLTHVYYFHGRNNEIDGLFYKSDDQKKWVIPRLIYSSVIYFFSLFGVINLYKIKEHRKILIYVSLSILYFTSIQSWYGGTRYFAPILIYLAFLFSSGVEFFIKKFR